MRNKFVKILSAASVTGALVAAQPVFASQSSDYTLTLTGISMVEMPVKAAALLSKSSAADKQNAAVAIVKAAVGLTPSAAPAIVSAVSRENPSVAAATAVAAATLQHKQLDLIAKAAVTAAPAQTAKIVAALLKEFPKDYSVIALSAAEANPSASRAILAMVAEYVPSLRNTIQVALAPGSAVSVATVLSQSSAFAATAPTMQSLPSATPLLSPPTIGAPFTTVPATVKTVTPAMTAPEGTGSRPYASP